MSITESYSGVILDQNALVSGSIDWRGDLDSQALYQTFFLPTNYEMGTTTIEQRYPDLSGFQVMVGIDAGYASCATLGWTLDYYVDGSGWNNLTAGTTIGNHTDGQCWFNVIFPQSVQVDSVIATSRMRFGIVTSPADALSTNFPGAQGNFLLVNEPVTVITEGTYLVENVTVYARLLDGVPYPVEVNGRAGFLLNTQGTVTFSVQRGLGTIYYTEDSPLVPSGNAYLSDGISPLLDANTSLNFRILGLTADSGTSFLGNEYRSCVILANGDADTGLDYWMSQPQPSPFSVVSRYFDMRPNAATLPYGLVNQIEDPSFEYDFPSSTTPYQWTAIDNSTTRRNFQVVNSWAYVGDQSLRSTSQFTGSGNAGVMYGSGSNLTPVIAGDPYSSEAVVNLLSIPQGFTGLQLAITWFNSSGSNLGQSTSSVAMTAGIYALGMNGSIAPPTSVGAELTVIGYATGAGTLDFEIDAVMFVPTTSIPPYIDGDQPGDTWTGQRGRSSSAQLIETVADETQVIDGVLVDPVTPNLAFSIYWSTDDSNNSDAMTEQDWEGKLWTRVPQVYIATQRQQYVLPEPINAKYIKIEFSDLPAQTYTPGTFTQPVQYKKFPLWVADFFITQLELPTFTANVVTVQDDALTLAYDYYLDDLNQSPASPQAPPENATTLTNYFSQTDASQFVDSATLAQINLVMQSYQVPAGSIVDPQTLIGQAATTISNNIAASSTQTAEVPSVSTLANTTVSTLNREPVVFEQSMPVMYFFVTCRHAYKQMTATFPTDKAYFAGTNTIQFLRSNYSTESDDSLYVESGGDNLNAMVNDFVLDDNGIWETY